MKILDKETKFAHLGKPGTAFSKGFQRRLDKILQQVDLKDKTILDQGCGEGVWLEQFAKFTPYENIYGMDIDPESIAKAKTQNSKLKTQNLVVCFAEDLKFEDNKFDIVFSNEVLEHVEDDKKSVEEVLRVLKPGGKFIIFTPNSGWPFETHGMFFRGKYYWGNIAFLPWMPNFIYKKFAPHVRNYSNSNIKSLLNVVRYTYGAKLQNAERQTYNFKVVHHSHVFPGFDGAVRRFGPFGKMLQKIFHGAEKTPAHNLGISHFIIAQKVS